MHRLLRKCSFVDLNGECSSEEEDDEEARLLGVADQQLAKAVANGSWGPIATALDHFEKFADTVRRVLFVSISGNSASQARAITHNEDTLRMFLAYLSERESQKPKSSHPDDANLSGGTMEGYVTHVRTAFSIHAGGRIDGIGLRIARQIKGLKNQDKHRPKKVRLPLRSTHFRAAAHAAPRRDSKGKYSIRELNRWALACVMHAALARAQEVGGDQRFDPNTGLSRAHITYYPEGAGSDRTPFAILMLRPLKSGAGMFERVPVVIAAGDGSWADAYAVLRLLEQEDPVEEKRRKSVPAFRADGRRHFNTQEISDIVRNICTACGLDPSLYSSHSLRIGGATDTAENGGTEVECRLAGRWKTDIWEIYARPCLSSRIAASRRLCLSESTDIETLLGQGNVVPFRLLR